MAKPVDLSIQFGFSNDEKSAKASFKPSGDIVFTDEEGKEIVPKYMDRAIQYDRPKGPKIQARHNQTGGLATVGGLKELTQYASIFVIDTNTKTLPRGKVSVSCFVCLRVVTEGEKFRLICDEGKGHTLEFYNVVGANPELLAILKLAKDVLKSSGWRAGLKFAVVTDTELGAHDSINARITPIYGPHCLPDGFSLLYASSDTGQEVLNRFLRFCDSEASKHLKALARGELADADFQTLPEDGSVKMRYMVRDGLKIVNPVVGGAGFNEGAQVTLYGRKRE